MISIKNVEKATKKLMKLDSIVVKRSDEYTYYICGDGCIILKVVSTIYNLMQGVSNLPEVGVGEVKWRRDKKDNFSPAVTDLKALTDRILEPERVPAEDTRFLWDDKRWKGKLCKVYASSETKEMIYLKEDLMNIAEAFTLTNEWTCELDKPCMKPLVSAGLSEDPIGAIVLPVKPDDTSYFTIVER